MNILIVIVAVLGVMCIALGLLVIMQMRENKRKAMESAISQSQRTEAYAQCDQLNTEIDGLDKDLQAARATIKAREQELAALLGEHDAMQTHFTLMGQALDAAHAEVERLRKPDLMTLPLTEAVQLEPPPGVSSEFLNKLEASVQPERPTRGRPKKAGGQ